jgi:hypothetical protein
MTPSSTHPIAGRSLWIVLLLLALLFHASTASRHHSWGDDFAQYILHARNLAEGKPYAETGYLLNPVDPAQLDVGPRIYPPLMPLLLSLVYGWSGLSFLAMKHMQAGLLVVAAWCSLWYGVRARRLDSSRATLFLGVLAFHPFLWEAKEYISADLLFLALVFASLLALERILETPHPRLWMAALAGASFYLASAARTVGVVLIPAALLLALFAQRPRRNSLLLAAGVGLTLLAAQNLWWNSDATYLRFLAQQASPRVALQNAVAYGKEFSAVWRNSVSTPAAQLLFLLSLPVAAWGAFHLLRKRIAAVDVFTLCYAAVLLVWPSFQGIRFLLPLLPVYLLYLFAGASRLSRLGPPILAGGLLLASAAHYLTRGYPSAEDGIDQPEFAELVEVIQKTTQPEDRFLFRKPRALALMANRPAAIYNSTRNDEQSWELIRQLGIGYVVAASLPGDFASDEAILLPFLEAHPEAFAKVYANRRFALYRVLRIP